MKIRRHSGNAGEFVILNSSDVINAYAEYMQRYHTLLDAAFEYATDREFFILANWYDSTKDKEREKATRMAIRILTRHVNKSHDKV